MNVNKENLKHETIDFNLTYDVIIVGAGHAGIEAGLASAKLGAKTAIFTMNLASVGNCPCSPSIGGTAKGTLVRELDALGGIMAKLSDECFLHSKLLGIGKGPAAQSLRVQIDRDKYKILAKKELENQENLHLRQAEIIKLIRVEDGWLVYTRYDVLYKTKAVILTCGTYLNSKVHVGDVSYKSGPDGIFAASFLTEALLNLDIKIKRFKTGTPARILKSSIDFDVLEVEEGDENVIPFSYATENIKSNTSVCYKAYTNEKTKDIILKNINRSSMYSGRIEGIGPRYCPSIEDKMVKFPDKLRHQVFVEPCGLNTEEIYLHGTSSSLPESVQYQFYRSIKGFEKAILMRPAYAIEYDVIDSRQLEPTLEFSNVKGLFSAGQINGTSGYEEAAAQGIIAGINAALNVSKKEFVPITSLSNKKEFDSDKMKFFLDNNRKFILDRSTSYIGTLIDDLITKGVNDPYRMMTSRSEYRLVLRFENADERLMPYGRNIGLISDRVWQRFEERIYRKENEIKRIKKFIVKSDDKLNSEFKKINIDLTNKPICLYDLLKYPEVNYSKLIEIEDNLNKKYNLNNNKKEFLNNDIYNDVFGITETSKDVLFRVEIFTKYEGYITRQMNQIKKMKKMQDMLIPSDIDYFKILNLSFEAREKLNSLKPKTLAEAGRISGVNPSDITVLLIGIEKIKKMHENI